MPSSSVSSTPDAGRAGWRERLGALAAYAVVAIVATWPLAWRPRALLGAPQGAGDPYLNLFTLGWDLRQLFHAPASWLNGTVFDAPIFHPARQTLAFTDHLLLQALLVSPVYAIWRDPVLCYNVVFVASLAASAWAMWWYLRQVLDDALGPLVGGLIWGFCAYRFSHVLHLQLQALYFLPLAFGALHRVVARRRWRDGAWLGLWFGLTALSSVYYAVIGLVALGLGGLALIAGAGRVSLGRLLAPLAVGALVSAALVGPVLVPYMQAQQREGFVRTMDEASPSRRDAGELRERTALASRPVGAHRADRRGRVAARLGRARAGGAVDGRLVPVASPAPALDVGGGGGRRRASSRSAPRASAACTPFAHRWVFGFQAVRAPARFGVLLAFGVAAAAGFAVTWWRREMRPAAASPRARPHRGRRARVARVACAVRAGARLRDAGERMVTGRGGAGARRVPPAARGPGRDAADARDARPRSSHRQWLQRPASGIRRSGRRSARHASRRPTPSGRCTISASGSWWCRTRAWNGRGPSRVAPPFPEMAGARR